MAIVLDKRVISCPSIKTPITDGSGIIEGSYTLESAKALVVVLKYGSLPVALEVIENRTVGATLGADSVSKSLLAGAIGLIIVMLFMLIYYRLPGFLADIALLIYALVSLALFKLIPVTLTLPGMTGFVLSIGMAVDANILIFERMKEELRAGKTLGAAIEAGFARAWTSIRDSNASTLITCAILFWFGMNFGASIIKGFALTLAIGVIVSLFTAITVSRTFLRLLVNTEYAKNHWLFGISGQKSDKSE
jgi:preprotein translocase subunit SecD